jgi:hypothetical protein
MAKTWEHFNHIKLSSLAVYDFFLSHFIKVNSDRVQQSLAFLKQSLTKKFNKIFGFGVVIGEFLAMHA